MNNEMTPELLALLSTEQQEAWRIHEIASYMPSAYVADALLQLAQAKQALADAQSRLLHTQAGLTIWMERSKSNARELDEAYDAMCDIAQMLGCAEDWAAIKAALKETLGKVWELATASSALVSALNTCHVCAGKVCLDTTEPTHCEDCSADCECHEEDECVPIYVLVDKVSAAIRAARGRK